MSQKIRHDQLRSVLIAPHVSEKTTMLSQESGKLFSGCDQIQISSKSRKPLRNFLM